MADDKKNPDHHNKKVPDKNNPKPELNKKPDRESVNENFRAKGVPPKPIKNS